MDERKLQEVFRDAARSAPPPSFDEQDVVRGSRRVTARRRMAAAGGSLVAAAVLAGGVGVGTGLFDQDETQVASPRPGITKDDRPKTEAPRSGDVHAPGDVKGPSILSGPEAGGCGAPDFALAGALSEQIPEAVGTKPMPATGYCATGSRGATFALRQGATAGRVTVILAPASGASAEQTRPGETRRPDGTKQVTSKARSGRMLTVVSDPDAGSPSPPYGDQLGTIAGDLAGRF